MPEISTSSRSAPISRIGRISEGESESCAAARSYHRSGEAKRRQEVVAEHEERDRDDEQERAPNEMAPSPRRTPAPRRRQRAPSPKRRSRPDRSSRFAASARAYPMAGRHRCLRAPVSAWRWRAAEIKTPRFSPRRACEDHRLLLLVVRSVIWPLNGGELRVSRCRARVRCVRGHSRKPKCP